MNYLQSKRIYLSGPIEWDTNPDWRIEPKRILTERFGGVVLDPAADDKQSDFSMVVEARKNKDYETLVKIYQKFVRKDLCMVDRSDFVISFLPYGVPTTGCHHEIVVADNAKKPVLLVCPEGKELVPLWFYGFIPHQCMFGGWDPLWEYLDGVDKGSQKENRRWSFVYGLL